MPGLLNGKVALITGGARGIGLAIGRCFLGEGCLVAFADIEAPAKDETALSQASARFDRVDISKGDAVEAWVDAVAATWGRLDVLVNNAALNLVKTAAASSEADWDRVMGVNLKGAWLAAKHAVPHLARRGGGSIINLASAHGTRTEPDKFPYNVSKAGMLGLTVALAVELGPHKIRVNSIVPGMVRSVFTEGYIKTFKDPEEAWRRILGEHPMGRIAEPKDIADCALFLASDLSGYISGTHIHVDGGREAQLHSFADIQREAWKG
ncbi:MAG: glucose 1-dehydrogenase [Proteobacteria bacterium]|nr:glucose 1-dehydrogenase [Pseudomonadota bacterium]MBI3500000.1 glucose 1-dehydrogenase [Pseudomonadota bacterium]